VFLPIHFYCGVEPEVLHQLSNLRALHKCEELTRGFLMTRRFEHDRALTDSRIERWRDLDVFAGCRESRRQRDREREDTGLRVARLHELRGLRDVFAQY
jgi:hypothetical protein